MVKTKQQNIRKKLTKPQLLWLYSRGGRTSGDVVWIKKKPYTHMSGADNMIYNIAVDTISEDYWVRRHTNISLNISLDYKNQI